MTRIGLVIPRKPQFLDMNQIVEHLRNKAEICLFVTGPTTDGIKQWGFEIRSADNPQRSASNSLWYWLFSIFGRIPKSRFNYLIMALFKAERYVGLQRTILRLVAYIRFLRPNFISFDFFLKQLKIYFPVKIDDIDVFFYFTELPSEILLTQIIRTKKPMVAYVYSWDHPCKQATFSKYVDRYLVWNSSMKNDVVTLQNIPPSRIQAIGASQFSYIKRYLASPDTEVTTPYDFDYYYYMLATYEPLMVQQETNIARTLAQTLSNISPHLKLVVRLYPMQKQTDLYDALADTPGIIVDSDFGKTKSGVLMAENELWKKLDKIHSAVAVIHNGSTVGLEASYLDTPTLVLDMQGYDYGVPVRHPLHLQKFVHQYQNQKYLLDAHSPNVIRDVDDLERTLRKVYKSPDDFLDYNRALRALTPLRDVNDIAGDIMTALDDV